MGGVEDMTGAVIAIIVAIGVVFLVAIGSRSGSDQGEPKERKDDQAGGDVPLMAGGAGVGAGGRHHGGSDGDGSDAGDSGGGGDGGGGGGD